MYPLRLPADAVRLSATMAKPRFAGAPKNRKISRKEIATALLNKSE